MKHVAVPHPNGQFAWICSFPETGSEPEVQKHHQFIFDLGEEIVRINNQRDELAAALEYMATTNLLDYEYQVRARLALSKVKEKK